MIGITRPMGTPVNAVIEQLRNSLDNYGYDTRLLKMSKVIQDDLVYNGSWPSDIKPHDRYPLLIEHGNNLCEQAGRNDELILRAVDLVRDDRNALLGSADLGSQMSDIPSEALTPERQESGRDLESGRNEHQDHDTRDTSDDANQVLSLSRRAYIIDNLKRENEVTTLRSIYGDHFILIGLQASEKVRRKSLTSTFEIHGVEPGKPAKDIAKDLMKIDWDEPGNYGQDMLRTFPMSDVFINVDKTDQAILGVRRTVDLLFGDPSAPGPTHQEFAMQLATQTGTRSPELGLRVGAVIMSHENDILAVGTNQHPSEGDMPYYDAGAVDLRHMGADTFTRLIGTGVLSEKSESDIKSNPEDFVAGLFAGPLKKSELRALTEYQRPVHAEMNALLAALRQRVSLTGATMYVSAYPCHNCAKHLIAIGLEVVYLSPYAKSRASAMYGKRAKRFSPFTGVAPRRFQAFFIDAKSADRKDDLGERLEWDSETKQQELPKVTPQISMRAKQDREDFATPDQ